MSTLRTSTDTTDPYLTAAGRPPRPRRMPQTMQTASAWPVRQYERTLPGVGSRRRQPRCRIPADVMIIRADGMSAPFWATAEDICTRGVFITARQQPEIDEVLLLKIVAAGQDQPMRVKARVVHRICGLGFGCQFLEMTPRTSRALSGLVAAAAAAPLPRRRLQ